MLCFETEHVRRVVGSVGRTLPNLSHVGRVRRVIKNNAQVRFVIWKQGPEVIETKRFGSINRLQSSVITWLLQHGDASECAQNVRKWNHFCTQIANDCNEN